MKKHLPFLEHNLRHFETKVEEDTIPAACQKLQEVSNRISTGWTQSERLLQWKICKERWTFEDLRCHNRK